MFADLAMVDLTELELSDALFERIRTLAYSICGINLHEGKKQLVKARLTKRIRLLGLSDFEGYVRYVERDSSLNEISFMIDSLTTNKTDFFREPKHFDFLKETIYPQCGSHGLRIWSAGCSSGEEPYSLAMHIIEHLQPPAAADSRILATDISRRVLEQAQQGRYNRVALQSAALYRERYFKKTNDTERLQIKPAVQSMVHFARLNLMAEWPMGGDFDVIFCRNVMIYFDKSTQQNLINRFRDYLKPGGHLFVGHAESLAGLDHLFQYMQPAVYRK